MRITIVVAILAFWFFSLPCGFLALAAIKDSSPSATPIKQIIPEAVNIGYSLIDPAHPLYFLKTAKEYLEVHFFSPVTDISKVTRNLEFAQRRLREVNSLIKDKRQDLIVPMMEQYKNYLNLTDKIAPDKENIKTEIAQSKARHIDVLMRLYDQIGDPAAKRAIRSAIVEAENYNGHALQDIQDPSIKADLTEKISQRQKLVCAFLSREASSSALNDTERYYFSQKARECKI
jgi:hypothetical protein